MTVEKKLYTIEPILEERIWGGQELIKMFYLRKDKTQYLDIHINSDTLVENKGRVYFKPYVVNRYSYNDEIKTTYEYYMNCE